MRSYTVVALFSFIATCAPQVIAQDTGSITGTVHGPYDDLVRYAPIQATNVESGRKHRTASERDGTYELSNLPLGTYTLKVNMPCCAYVSFESDPVAVTKDARLMEPRYLATRAPLILS